MEKKKKFAAQVALIERVRGELGLSLEEMAEILVIKPETMRKIANGYQGAGQRLLADIKRLTDLPSLSVRQKMAKAETPSTTPPRRPKVPALAHRVAYILANALPEEEQLVTKLIDAAFEQVAKRIEAEGKPGKK